MGILELKKQATFKGVLDWVDNEYNDMKIDLVE